LKPWEGAKEVELQKGSRVGWGVLRGNPGVKYVDWGNVDIVLVPAISLLSFVSFLFPNFLLFPGFIFLVFSSLDGSNPTCEWYGDSQRESGMFYWSRGLRSKTKPRYRIHFPHYNTSAPASKLFGLQEPFPYIFNLTVLNLLMP